MALTIGGTIRRLRQINTQKPDANEDTGQIIIMNEDGVSVNIRGPKKIIDGYTAEEQVVVKVSRANKTIDEATKKPE